MPASIRCSPGSTPRGASARQPSSPTARRGCWRRPSLKAWARPQPSSPTRSRPASGTRTSATPTPIARPPPRAARARRAELRKRGRLKTEVNLGALTDLVALGTIADVVPLDANNRNLVAQGLHRIRAGKAQSGLAALLRAAGRNVAEVSSFDLGFVAGPRLNAAGRLADMSPGIECLITDDEARAANSARELDRLNGERRKIESGMLEQALETLKTLEAQAQSTFFAPDWHEGVVGILASRLKDRLHKPVISFAPPAA